ncbi:MAG TPA: hypothetical protein V6C58_25975, partial [Allocoleopsis sp.]
GKQIGEHLGSMLPFQQGGVVPPGQRVFHSNAMVARRPSRKYQKSRSSKTSGKRKSRKSKK